MKKCLLVGLVLVALVALGAPAQADTYSLVDRNSTAFVDTGTSQPNGMVDWWVNGVNYLYQQWFWYRVNAAGTPSGQNQIGTLPLIGAKLSDGDFDAGNETLLLSYGPYSLVNDAKVPTGLEIDVLYTLTGGLIGSQTADIAETITISNHGSSSLDLSFFQYSDFDLSADLQDTVSLPNPNTVRQSGSGLVLSETVVTPVPSGAELALFASTRNALETVPGYDLNNDTSTKTGDATWAFQWNFTLGHNQSFIISKDKNLAPIPEPGSMLLLGTGLFGLAGAVRRRLKK